MYKNGVLHPSYQIADSLRIGLCGLDTSIRIGTLSDIRTPVPLTRINNYFRRRRHCTIFQNLQLQTKLSSAPAPARDLECAQQSKIQQRKITAI